MAWYCDLNCQKKDWKSHKKCCKKLKQGVDLVLGSGKRKLVPYPLVEQTGFVEDFDESKNRLPKNGKNRFDYEYAWEYHGVDETDPTMRVWKKYPPLLSYSIECLRDLGSPAYIYRPNDHDSEGMEQFAPFPKQTPPGRATRYVYFDCRMEFEVNTGAARAVRRIGEEPTATGGPPLSPEMVELMEQLFVNR
ncbi:MAG: hypothetical protein SGBAC_009671 [Bacillariaceae sp.]